jgi:hypothetical protein
MELDSVFLSRLQFGFVISFSHRLPLVYDWARHDRGCAIGDRQAGLPACLRFLAQDIRPVVRDGRGQRNRNGISIRD